MTTIWLIIFINMVEIWLIILINNDTLTYLSIEFNRFQTLIFQWIFVEKSCRKRKLNINTDKIKY